MTLIPSTCTHDVCLMTQFGYQESNHPESGIQVSERFSLSDPGHVIREPSHNGLGAVTLQGPWTHIMPVSSRTMAHLQLTTLMANGWVPHKGSHESPNTGMIIWVQFCPTSPHESIIPSIGRIPWESLYGSGGEGFSHSQSP